MTHRLLLWLTGRFIQSKSFFVKRLVGELIRAEELYREALEMLSATLGANHPDYAQNLLDLAELYSKQKIFDKALPLYEKASLCFPSIMFPMVHSLGKLF